MIIDIGFVLKMIAIVVEKMMRLCRLDEDGWYPVKLPWEYVQDLYQNVKFHIFSFLDKDTKHAIICKIIHRHKKPAKIQRYEKVRSVEDILKLSGRQFAELQSDAILESIGSSWNCVRCNKECKLNLQIDLDYSPWSDWKNYVKVVEMPHLINEFTSLPRKDIKKENNFWSNIL